MSGTELHRRTTTTVLRTAGLAALVAAALAVPASASAVGDCRIAILPVPAGTGHSLVHAGDPTGRYLVGQAVVANEDGTSTAVPVRWVNGRLASFPALAGPTTLVDVNATGMVAGYTLVDGRVSGFRYHHGRFTMLPALRPGDDSRPIAMNSRGDVLGASSDATFDQRIVVWPGRGPLVPRELVAPVPLNAIDIDDDGTALGSAFGAQATTYVWGPDGTARQVRGPSGGTDVLALAIRDGWIGGFDNYTTNSTVVAWRIRGGPTNVVPGWQDFVYTVNGHGDLGLQGAIDRRHGGLVILPDLGGPSGATVLSDRGPAAGFANDGSQVHAVTWRGC